jgi:hypothetical protein
VDGLGEEKSDSRNREDWASAERIYRKCLSFQVRGKIADVVRRVDLDLCGIPFLLSRRERRRHCVIWRIRTFVRWPGHNKPIRFEKLLLILSVWSLLLNQVITFTADACRMQESEASKQSGIHPFFQANGCGAVPILLLCDHTSIHTERPEPASNGIGWRVTVIHR